MAQMKGISLCTQHMRGEGLARAGCRASPGVEGPLSGAFLTTATYGTREKHSGTRLVRSFANNYVQQWSQEWASVRITVHSWQLSDWCERTRGLHNSSEKWELQFCPYQRHSCKEDSYRMLNIIEKIFLTYNHLQSKMLQMHLYLHFHVPRAHCQGATEIRKSCPTLQ